MKFNFCKGCALIGCPIVYGHKGTDNRIVFIGEAPGYTEVEQGRPFVGKAGKLLKEILDEIGCGIDKYSISNSVLCHPISSDTKKNRAPTPLEIEHCNYRLLKSIERINPKIIIALGGVAHAALTGVAVIKMSYLVGKKSTSKNNYPVITTYHPSYALRNYEAIEQIKKHVMEAINALG